MHLTKNVALIFTSFLVIRKLKSSATIEIQ